jgi:hypothetical protein
MTSQDNSPRIVSVDLDPDQRGFLSLPSPYHDSFSFSSTPHAAPTSEQSRHRISNPFSTLLKNFRYTRLKRNPADPESHPNKDDNCDDSDSESETPRNPKHTPHWSDYEETPTDRWFAVVFLLLLLSILFNFFLLFNGPHATSIAARYKNPRDNPLPHKGFRFREHGKNYTCYETHMNVFKANYEFSNTFGAYDYLWAELQGKSQGVVYTDLGRNDGQTRRAGLAMFHQLDCLAKLRNVIQALQEGNLYDDVDVAEHHGYWPHCLDYLRQTILCNADDSLEKGEVVDGRWVTSGFGAPKECRDSSWLYDVTGCGESGCPGKLFYLGDEALRKVHMEEEKEVEKWMKEHRSGT